MHSEAKHSSPSSRNAAFVRNMLVWLPTLAYVCFILIMSTRPAPRLPHIRQIDKFIHAAAYSVLAILFYRSFYRSGFARPVVWAIVLAIAIGATDESIQAFNPFRTASLYDLLADGIGASIGSLASKWIVNAKRARTHHA